MFIFFSLQMGNLQAQYFGRNKSSYGKFDFKVNKTEHFEIYEYLNNPEKVRELAAAAELWYKMHQQVLNDTIQDLNPMLIYNDHPGFQQTNAIQGDISVGTGGVTEALRNRVIFPIAPTNQQTNHVMGHELVHAFQYNLILKGDSTGLQNLNNLPLWMVEGLAEYLSIGRIDPHTAMWMRDAVMHNDVPRFKDLDNYAKYFPYRWGQAYWAFITGIYGDEIIPELFLNTAKLGLKKATLVTLGVSDDTLSNAWQKTIKDYYGQWLTASKETPIGKKLLSEDNSGDLNISPTLSNSGKYVIFLSEKSILSIDLYLADAKTGKIIRKVASSTKDGHIDQYNFIESSGTWSPDDKKFAYDVHQGGRSVLVIQDVFKGSSKRKLSFDNVPSFSNPAWSPDGKNIVVSGLVNGQTDLYLLDIRTGKAKQLTNDCYSEILPSWSANGRYLIFSTDNISMQRGRINGKWTMNIAIMDMTNGTTENIDIFPGADNMNPQMDNKGDIWFLSDQDGFRNMYKYEISTKKVFRMTQLKTGISGITQYAPAISIADSRDRILYTYYSKGKYTIYSAQSTDFQAEEIVKTGEINQLPAALPPFVPGKKDIVNRNIRLMESNYTLLKNTKVVSEPYNSKFQLSYIGGGAGAGVMTGNNTFGNAVGLAGGIEMLFDDILGNNQIYTGISMNGEVANAAGQVTYVNRTKRLGWGLGLSHIPYITRSDYQYPTLVNLKLSNGDSIQAYKEVLSLERVFQERANLFSFYPFSSAVRVEGGASFEYYSNRSTDYITYYTLSGLPIAEQRVKGPKGPSFKISSANMALVGDNSYFGVTAPLTGWRYRLGVEQYFNDFNYTSVLVDGRRYLRFSPFTLALRGLAYGRLGGNGNQISPLYIGNPWFIRGYESQNLYSSNPAFFNRLVGSKIGIANVELRLPFTGPRKLALISSKFLLTDINLFYDAGVAFFNTKDLENPSVFTGAKHTPISSAGISLRLNLFGALIIEPYYAFPISFPKEDRKWVFGLNFLPGW